MADAEMYPSSDDDNDGTSHHDSGASDVDAFSQWHSDPSNGLLNKDHKRTATDFGNGDGYFESKANGTDASHSDSAAVTLALRGAPNVASFAKATCHGLRGAVDYIVRIRECQGNRRRCFAVRLMHFVLFCTGGKNRGWCDRQRTA